jgi:hypothetical protein
MWNFFHIRFRLVFKPAISAIMTEVMNIDHSGSSKEFFPYSILLGFEVRAMTFVDRKSFPS